FQAHVRHKAIENLGIAYANLGMHPTPSEQGTNIANAILGAYRTMNRDDQLAVEKAYLTYMVPVELSASYRMTLLYRLYNSLNEESLLSFTNLHKNVPSALKCLKALMHDIAALPLDQLQHGKSKVLETLLGRQSKFSRGHSELISALHQSKEPCAELAKALEQQRPSTEIRRRTAAVLASLKPRSKSHALVDQLVCRATCCSLNAEDVDCLLAHIADYATERRGTSFCTAKDLRLLQTLATAFPSALFTDRMLLELEGCLVEEGLADDALRLMVLLGPQAKNAGGRCLASFLTVFKRLLLSGTAWQAKQAAWGLRVTIVNPAETLPPIVLMLKELLSLGEEVSITALVALGHLAEQNPDFFAEEVSATLRGEVIRGLIFSDADEQLEDLQGSWLDYKDLPLSTQIKSTAMKTSVRWLAGLKTATDVVEEYFDQLKGIIERQGDTTGHGCISDPERSWMLYRAAVSMLKLCCCSTYFDVITPVQFQLLARIMTHDVMEVRMHFSQKLCKYLSSLRLPVWFAAILAYAACERSSDLKHQVEGMLLQNFAARRAAIDKYRLGERTDRLYNLHPDYALPHAIHLMAHDPEFTHHEDLAALSRIKMCLFFLMKPLFRTSPVLDVEFYLELFRCIKQVRDRQNPSDEEAHLKLYAVSDVAIGIALAKAPASRPLVEPSARPALPFKLYVVPRQLERLNETTYLTKELCFTPPKNRRVDMSAYGLKPAKIPRVYVQDTSSESESSEGSLATFLEGSESDG
ncbi:unnamed protein product, partial [Ixodes hexagonus]